MTEEAHHHQALPLVKSPLQHNQEQQHRQSENKLPAQIKFSICGQMNNIHRYTKEMAQLEHDRLQKVQERKAVHLPQQIHMGTQMFHIVNNHGNIINKLLKVRGSPLDLHHDQPQQVHTEKNQLKDVGYQ